MSASSRRSIDTDNITLRTIYARGASNAPIQSTLVLTADGQGGTRWTHPSSLGAYSLKYISSDFTTLKWDLSQNNVFYFNSGQGAGLKPNPANPYQLTVYGKAYQNFYDRTSNTAMSVLDSTNQLYSTINLSTTSWQVYASFDSNIQTMYLNTNPTKFLVGLTVPEATSTNVYTPCEEVNFDNVNSTIRLIGVGDIHLSTVHEPQQTIYVSISTFTSKGYIDLSGQVHALRNLSTFIPYNYRSSFTLDKTNSLVNIGKPLTLSTPYVGRFEIHYFRLNALQPGDVQRPDYSPFLVPSSIGFPYTAAGLRSYSNYITATTITDPGGTIYATYVYERGDVTTYGGDAYLSSLTFNMSYYSSIVDRNSNASIQLIYKPSFMLDSATANADQLLGVSSFITYADKIVPGSVVENIHYPLSRVAYSNQVTPNLLIDLPYNFVRNNYLSNYTVYHFFPSSVAGFSNVNGNPTEGLVLQREGFSTPKLKNLTTARNCATISIVGLYD